MKIVIVGPAHPYRGGIADLNEALAAALQEQGHEVQLLNFTLQYPSFLFPGKTQYTDAPAPENLSITRIINSVNPLSWWKAARFLKKSKAELVIIRYWLPLLGPCLGTIARLVRSKTTKVLAIADNIIPHEKRPGDRPFTRYFINGIDGFLVMSKQVKDDLLQFNPDKPVVYSPHPLYSTFGEIVSKDTALETLGLDKDFHYILFFGFIRRYKGLDLLLEAFADQRLRDRKLKIIVAGEFYEDERPYIDFIQQKGIENKVLLHTKYIPKDFVKYYFCSASIVVQPYRSATQSGVTQIAYHFERPMLVTNVGGLPEMLEDGKAGYVVDVNAEKVADAIVDFFKKDREQEFVEGVRELKKQYEWPAFINKLNELYNKA